MTETISLGEPPGDTVDAWRNIFFVQRCIQKAKKVIVVTGAGISVASGIPDFRSENGIFATLRKQYPKQLASGTDLFNASLFSNDDTRALFYHLTAELKRLANDATPSHVHKFIKQLDSSSKLQRVYTQNIDNLETQMGLKSADFEQIDPAARANETVEVKEEPATSLDERAASSSDFVTVDIPKRSVSPSYSIPCRASPAPVQHPYPTPAPSPNKNSVKTVYLHGSLASLRCPKCHNVIPFTEDYRQVYAQGRAPVCGNCTGLELARQATEKRSMGTGLLRPTVVLYGEFHPDGEAIGEFTAKDLKARPDCLIVIGTSLKVPGIKRLVKEMSKSVHTSRGEKTSGPNRSHTGLTIYLNMEKQKGAEWDGVFDYFVQGDCQEGVKLLNGEGQWTLPASVIKELTSRKRKAPADSESQKKVKLNGTEKDRAISNGTSTKSEIDESSAKTNGTAKSPAAKKAKAHGDIRDQMKAVKKPRSMKTVDRKPMVPKATAPKANGTKAAAPKGTAKRTPSESSKGSKSNGKAPSTKRSASSSRSSSSSLVLQPASRSVTPKKRA